MDPVDIEALADEYIAQYVSPIYQTSDNIFLERKVDWPAAQKVIELSSKNETELLWRFVLQVLAKTSDVEIHSMVAAGPLEELIDRHGPEVIDRIEALARSSRPFQQMLHGVWRRSTPADIWARIEAARGGFDVA